MDKLVSIGKAAKILGVSELTLRRWDEDGRLVARKTEGGHRRYDISEIRPEMVRKFTSGEPCNTIAYARVSSEDQADALRRQKQALGLFCSKNGWPFEIISDIGSGVNYYKKGLTRLLNALIEGKIGRLVLTSKDRLLLFGAELVFSICEAKGVEVVIINATEDQAFEEDLAADMLEIIAVFTARMYGSRNKRNKKLLVDMARAAEENHA